MKIIILFLSIFFINSTFIFSQTTYDVLRLSNAGHIGVLQFGFSDVVFENAVDGNGFALQIKNWNNNVYTNTLRINANGNVGIGVLNPSSRLEVKGDLKLSDGTANHKGSIKLGSSDVIIENSPDGDNYADLQFKNWYNGAYVNTLRIKAMEILVSAPSILLISLTYWEQYGLRN